MKAAAVTSKRLKCFSGRWCPEENAKLWSRLFFCYVDSILRLGYSKPLNQEDIWDLGERDKATKYAYTCLQCMGI